MKLCIFLVCSLLSCKTKRSNLFFKKRSGVKFKVLINCSILNCEILFSLQMVRLYLMKQSLYLLNLFSVSRCKNFHYQGVKQLNFNTFVCEEINLTA